MYHKLSYIWLWCSYLIIFQRSLISARLASTARSGKVFILACCKITCEGGKYQKRRWSRRSSVRWPIIDELLHNCVHVRPAAGASSCVLHLDSNIRTRFLSMQDRTVSPAVASCDNARIQVMQIDENALLHCLRLQASCGRNVMACCTTFIAFAECMGLHDATTPSIKS